MKKTILLLGASVIALTLAGPSYAQSSSDLQQRVDDLEATIDALRSEISDIRKQPEFKPTPNFASSKGDYAFKFRGQIAADAAVFNNRKGPNDYNDGTQLRRARLGVDGTIATDWLYRLEIEVGNASRDDNTNNELDVKDAYVQYKGIENTVLTIGQHKTPNTLEQALPSTDTLFVEQPLFVQAFTDRITAGGDYKAGISAKYTAVNWTATAGFYGENYGANGGTGAAVYKDEGWGVAGRVTYAPINGVRETLHLGVSGYWRDPGARGTAAVGGVRFRATPEFSVDSTRLIDTGNIAAKSYNFVGGELAGQYGPIYLQSEYGQASVNRTVGSNVKFDGGYVSASWVITGENRDYKGGAFARPKPKQDFSLSKGGWGAWEVAARYSTLDLNDSTIVGGKQDNYSVGVNWYPNNYIRVLTDYTRFDAKRGAVVNKGDALVTRVAVIW